MSALFKVATGACLGLSLILLPVSGVQAAPVTDILLEANPASSWLHANGNWAAYRYSELRQINPANAGDLGAAWVARGLGPRELGGVGRQRPDASRAAVGIGRAG